MKLDFSNVYHIQNRKQQIYNLFDVSLSIPTQDNLSILTVHKRSSDIMLQLIAGIKHPTRGKITRVGRYSPPLNDICYFHSELSGEENIRFHAKLYGQNPNELIKKVQNITGLKKELKKKTKLYVPLLRRKISLSTMFMMDFDVYLLSGELATYPQPGFNAQIQKRFKEIAKQSPLIIANNDSNLNENHMHTSLLIDSVGRLSMHNNVDSGQEALNLLKQSDS